MTVQSTDRKAGPFFSGTILPFDFKVFSKEDIQVIWTSAAGVESILVLDSEYSVTLNPDQDNTPGGSVTLNTAITAGANAVIIGDLVYDQGTDIRNQSGFEPEIVEDALDRVTILVQQLLEMAKRTLRIPASSSSAISTQLPVLVGNYLLGTTPDGTGFQLYPLSSTPQDAGSTVYNPAGIGAVATTQEEFNNRIVHADNFGSNTAAVQAAIDSLGGTSGFVFIGRSVVYDFSLLSVPQNVTLFDQRNNRIVFKDCSIEDGAATNLLLRSPINGATRVHTEPRGYPVGTAAKHDWMLDPYQEDQINYRVFNVFTKTYNPADVSTTQGNNGINVVSTKSVGDHFGVWPAIHFGFSDGGALSAVPMKMYYFDTSDTVWRTPLKGAWRTGVSTTAGDYILANNKMYQAVNTAITGATKPSHVAGTVSDGAVDWTFIRDFAAASGSIRGVVVFGDRDELPKFGLPTCRVQFSQDAAFWNGKKLRFLDNANLSAWSIYTNGATDDLYIETEDGARRFRLDRTGQFLQITGLAVSSNGVAAVDLDTTPSIKGIRTLVFNNSGPTSVTQFDEGINYQEFYVRTGNSQTTLVHGANLRLIGGVNKTLGVDDALLFQMNGSGTVAVQVS